jgi:hypothetical protein
VAAIGILRFSINSSSSALEERVRRVFAVRSGWIEQCPDVRDEFLALGQAGFDAGKGFFRRLKFLNLGRSGEKRFHFVQLCCEQRLAAIAHAYSGRVALLVRQTGWPALNRPVRCLEISVLV